MNPGGQTQSKTENRDPWAQAQPYLTDIMARGRANYESGAGSQLYGGPLQAPLSAQTNMGINALTNTANSQMGSAGQPLAYGQNQIQNNGLTSAYNAPLSTYGGISSGANGITTGGAFGDVANAAGGPTSSATNLAGMASGADAGQNPYLMKMIQDNANVIGNRVDSQMSGAGRYGSAGHGDALARSISAANNPLLSSAYESDRNRMLSASEQIDSANNAARQTQLGALTGQTGVQGQNISNQLQGAAGQTGIANFGQNNAAQWAGMIPALQQASYMPGQQLMAAGDYQNQYNQQGIDLQRQMFDQQQQTPWTQLAKYAGSVSGLSPLMANAGTTTGTAQTQQMTPWTQYAGLGIAGLGMLSDRNEKTDIKKLGKDEETGLDLYAYRYKGDPKSYPKIVGPMAQDIEKAMPGSTDRVGGKLYVKPEALGILALRSKKAA